MQRFKIKRGLDLPMAGAPKQEISPPRPVETVALLGPDYIGMKPTLAVKAGDRVKRGQLLFVDKTTPGVGYTAPACGEVLAVHRGAKRVLQSVVIRITGDDAVHFASYAESQLTNLDGDKVKTNLVASGLWTALRSRPFGKVPSPQSTPRSIFVTAMDTNPHAAEASRIIAERVGDFLCGLKVLARLTPTKVYLCKAAGSTIPGQGLTGVEPVEFAGPHPAGLPGTHIHYLDPVSRNRTVWYVGFQDVMAIGTLFVTGQLDCRRIISLAGPAVKVPRLIRTRLGASTSELVAGELAEGTHRVISGSVLSGRTAAGPLAFLGRYHGQISALAEGTVRELFGWMRPGFDKFSLKNVFVSKLFPGRQFAFTTAVNGSARAIFPIGSYEGVMPLDILPTFLLRALAVDDVEQAEALGCLELDEEDLALCTFVCPGKGDYGTMLRRNLTTIEKEG